MTVGTLTINGTELSSIGAWLYAAPEWLDAPSRDVVKLALPGRQGSLATRFQEKPGLLTLTGRIAPSTPTTANRVAAEQAFKALCHGPVELVFDDGAGLVRTIEGYVSGCSVRPAKDQHPFNSLVSEFDVRVDCPDAAWRDRAPLPYGFGSTRVGMPIGTAPVAPLIRVFGAATDPHLKVRTAAGDLVAEITLTITLAADDWLELDGNTYRIEKVVSGTRSDAYSVYAGNTANLPVLDPRDGDALNAVYPTLEVTSGTAIAIYRRRWR